MASILGDAPGTVIANPAPRAITLFGRAAGALAPRVGCPFERAVAQEHAMQAGVLARAGPDLDAATGELGADRRRKARCLAAEARAARDQVGQVDGLLQRQVPVHQA